MVLSRTYSPSKNSFWNECLESELRSQVRFYLFRQQEKRVVEKLEKQRKKLRTDVPSRHLIHKEMFERLTHIQPPNFPFERNVKLCREGTMIRNVRDKVHGRGYSMIPALPAVRELLYEGTSDEGR